MSDEGSNTSQEREFMLNGSRLVLYKTAEELTQGDFDRFFAAFQLYPQGELKVEDEGKKLRAAFDAKWIEALVFPDGPIQSAGEVSGIHPQWRVRWAAGVIDAVLIQARTIPKA